MSESQQKDFTRQIQTQPNKGGSEPNTNDTAAEKVLNQIIEDSEQTGEAGKNLGRILVERIQDVLHLPMDTLARISHRRSLSLLPC